MNFLGKYKGTNNKKKKKKNKMNAIIIGYYNKTGINYPYCNRTVEAFHLDMSSSFLMCKKENFLKGIETLKSIERALIMNTDKYGCMTEKTYEKASKQLNYPDSTSMMMLWISIIYHYEKNGMLDCNNDANGIVIQSTYDMNIFKEVKNHFDMVHKSLQVCAICKIKGSFKCPLCNQNYCCKEHQKQDWKTHKKICRPKLKLDE